MNFCNIVLNCNSFSMLEGIYLMGHIIEDNIINELENNIYHSICDKRSIGSIYSSNQTFHMLTMNNDLYNIVEQPQNITSVLNTNKKEVAHRYQFFSGQKVFTKSKVFISPHDCLLQYLLYWIIRHNRSWYFLMHSIV